MRRSLQPYTMEPMSHPESPREPGPTGAPVLRQLAARAFWLPKSGHTQSEYEDAFHLPGEGGPPWRAAVADGATESAFARTWARCLVRGFGERGTAGDDDFGAQLEMWQAAWRASVAPHVNGLAWYAAAKAEEGAHATFLGVSCQADGSWRALSVGDCCLFHLRGDDVLRAWPLETADAFTNRPPLLPSRPDRPAPEPLALSATCRPGDTLLLATDALAAWLLQTGPAVARTFTPSTFAERIVQARADRSLRNDDVTLVVLDAAG